MRIRPSALLLAAALVPAAFFIGDGCSKTDSTSKRVQRAKAEAAKALADVKAAVSDSWDSIKDFTYERRADFSEGMDRMARELDDGTAALKARAAGAPDAASREREAAIKEYERARAELRVRLADLANATSATWADAKARACDAWRRMQAAYDRATRADSAP
jgi:soluble cytochrome b562